MFELKTRSVVLSVIACCLLFATPVYSQPSTPALDTYSPDTLLVSFMPGTQAAIQAEAHRSANATVVRTLTGSDVKLVQVQSGTVNRGVEAYRRNPNIEHAERNFRRVIYLPSTVEGSESISTLTFDNFNEQWNLHNLGQEFGLTLSFNGNYLYPSYEGAPDADIDAPEAWSISHGDSSITIAILDTGVACGHLDLQGKCAYSLSFVSDKSTTTEDILGHGTHVAGIAAANTDNGIGIAGVGWNSSIAALKTCWEDDSNIIYGVILGVCDDSDVIEAINHASATGHQVISMSFAGSESNIFLEDAIDSAWANGAILVAAAGNTYTDDILYPAGYQNVISVGSTDHQDNLSAFSNHGAAASLLAPGSHIVSTVPGEFCGQAVGEPSDCYDTKSGTSMAAPHVAGLTALMMARYPAASNSDIRTALESTAEGTGALLQNMRAWSEHGRINMHAALLNDPTGPGNQTPTSVLVQSPPVLSTVNASRGSKFGKAVVFITDDLGAAVSGASVTGTFSSPFTEQLIATTGNDGSAEFMTELSVKGGVTFEFCVTDIDTSLEFPISGNECATF